MSMKSTLIAAASVLVLTGVSQAGGHGYVAPGAIVNTALTLQENQQAVRSVLKFYGEWIGGDVRLQSVAVGNNLTWNTEGGAFLDNTQRQLADVSAKLYGTVHGAGSVDASAVAVCNNASAYNGKSGNTVVRNDQRCLTLDPSALAVFNGAGVGGDASVTTTAISNNLQISAETAATFVYSGQINGAATNAVTIVNLSDVGGAATAAATAVGNNLSINSGFGR